MSKLLDHPVSQFIVIGMIAVAFILALKTCAAQLPDGAGARGAVKNAIASI